MTALNKEKLSLFWLKIAAFSVFLGRGWQHLAWDTPYTVLVWDEDWMIKQGNDWSYIVNELFSDRVVGQFSTGMGLYFFLVSIMVLFINNKKTFLNRIFSVSIFLASFVMLLISFLYCKNRFFEIPQFLEYTLQWSSPLFLLYVIRNGWTDRLGVLLKIALLITFSSHGLYALGIYPLPVHFMEMTMGIMNIDEDSARLFLNIAGVMDFIVSILIFLNIKWMKSGLIYMILWGFLTALARTVYLVDMDFTVANLNMGLPHTIYRMCHFCIPILVFLKLREVG